MLLYQSNLANVCTCIGLTSISSDILRSKEIISLSSLTFSVLQATAFHLNYLTFNFLTSVLTKACLFFVMLCLN